MLLNAGVNVCAVPPLGHRQRGEGGGARRVGAGQVRPRNGGREGGNKANNGKKGQYENRTRKVFLTHGNVILLGLDVGRGNAAPGVGHCGGEDRVAQAIRVPEPGWVAVSVSPTRGAPRMPGPPVAELFAKDLRSLGLPCHAALPLEAKEGHFLRNIEASIGRQ